MCISFQRLCFLSLFFIPFLGCVAPGVRISSLRWNLQNNLGRTRPSEFRSLEIASKSNSELSRMMDKLPSPSPDELIGTWYGVNKGHGAAWLGIHQDVKVFYRCDAGMRGHNILVEQVALEDLAESGWRPKRNWLHDEPLAMGNFVIDQRDCKRRQGTDQLLLDYGLAQNKALDPSRFLVDELVVVEPGLMLGRVRMKLGPIECPIAYFVLSRSRGASDCDEFAN